MKLFSLLLCLAFFPGAVAGQVAKTYQIAENNVVIRFAEQHVESAAREILTTAVNARQGLTEKYQLAFTTLVEIQLCATTYEFCQITGRPWWQASVYRGHVIYLQPLRILRERGIIETTLRHELMHQFVDEKSKGNSPTWLTEALAVYHSGEITFLKPTRKKISATALEWSQLEKHLEKTATKADAERLYFQLYHLGQFLEASFNPDKIALLLTRLGEGTPFDQACREVCGMNAKALEQNWLQYAAEKID